MLVYRTANKKYINQLDGKGGLIVEGRWHSRGHEVIYTSSSMALSLLEVFKIHNLEILPLNTFGIEIEIPDKDIEVFDILKLIKGWNNPLFYNSLYQKFGDQWLIEKRSLALKVPSAVIPSDYNYILNPNHPLFKNVRINRTFELKVENGYLVI